MTRFNEALCEALFMIAVAVAIVPLPLVAQHAADRPAPIAVTADLGVVSRYLWRGYDLAQGHPAVQLTATLAAAGAFEVSAFGSRTMAGAATLDDAQLSLTYRAAMAGLEWTIGYVAYAVPGEAVSGEAAISVSGAALGADITVTYGRGTGAGAGNSVNVWVEREVALRAERIVLAPYVQADYLDAYGLPAVLQERVTAVEIGVPVQVRLGAVNLVAGAGLTIVPSRTVRQDNLDNGARTRGPQPWLSLGVSYAR